MPPSKGSLEVEGRKCEGQDEERAGGKGVLGVTSAFEHLSLHVDSPKGLDKLEAQLMKISLNDAETQEEDLERKEDKAEEEQDDIKEKHAEKSVTEEEDKEKEEDVKEKEAEKSETEQEEEEEEKEEKVKEKEAEEKEKKTEEEEEEEEEKKATADITEKKDEEDDTILAKREEGTEDQVTREKDEGEEKEKQKEEEEEESDDENPTEEAVDGKPKFRSRGLLDGRDHGYSPSSHLDYQGYQQQPQQQIQYQQSTLSPYYIGMPSPQPGNVAISAGASPTYGGAAGDMQWYSGGQLETECGNGLFPSLAEGSPVSICSSGDGDSQWPSWGLDSPQHQYHEGNGSYYPSQQTSYPQYEPSPNHQYQQLSPPHYPDNSLSHGVTSPCCQYGGYPERDHLDAGYPDQVSQDVLFPSNACMPPMVHATPITPPFSPMSSEMPTEGRGDIVEEIFEAITSTLADGEPRMPQDERELIKIKKSLMDIGQLGNLKEGLDEDSYKQCYRAFASHTDEELVKPDEDGDIMIMLAASQGQEQTGYRERLVALTERMETINVCCNKVVDWHDNRCQVCGNTNRESFYSPLSWMNNYGQMVLSNVVLMMYPLPVVEYLTNKVMQRREDLRRTFKQHYDLFANQQSLYPCLAEPLRMVE